MGLVMLLIIDVQKCYIPKSTTPVVENIKKEIARAIGHNELIVFLEYTDIFGNMQVKDMTHLDLLSMVANYNRAFLVRKTDIDGSEEVCKLLHDLHRSDESIIRIVGTETECCVASTVNSLADKLPSSTIIVIGDGCQSGFESVDAPPHETGLDTIKVGENVQVQYVTSHGSVLCAQ